MDDAIYRGVLTGSGKRSFLLGENGTRHLEDEIIWSGYTRHWTGHNVFARGLPQKDYETGRPIIIMWPDEPARPEPFVETYFNERLVKYPASYMGHMAVNVSGEIFNYSHKTNENEVLRHEEYFYRPALGEFAPHPVSGRDNADDPERPYYDKFGRLFMRTIHVLRMTGLDTQKMSQFFHGQLEVIRNTPPDPKRPGYYTGFSFFTRNCATIIRDGFRQLGYKKTRGVFPRELFVNLAYFFLKQNNDPSLKISLGTLKQLSVSEAAPSAMPPLVNPCNWRKNKILNKT